MICDRMVDFMSHHDRYARFILTNRNNPCIKSHLPARHTPGIYLIAFNKHELPGEPLQYIAIVIRLQVFLHGGSDSFTDPYHFLSIGSIGDQFTLAFYFPILLVGQGQDLRIAYDTELTPAAERDSSTTVYK